MSRSLPRHSRSARQRIAVAVIGAGLLASACANEGTAPDNPAADAAGAAAASNIDQLASSDNVVDIEVLDVADGSISSLRDAVDGDRPVLLWFWAPH